MKRKKIWKAVVLSLTLACAVSGCAQGKKPPRAAHRRAAAHYNFLTSLRDNGDRKKRSVALWRKY